MSDDAGSRADDAAQARRLLEEWTTKPAFVGDRHLTVVAANELARAISPGFVEGVNLVRFAFLDQSGNEPWPECSQNARQVAALLRESLDRNPDDSSYREIVGELSAKSRDFSSAWAEERPSTASGWARFRNDVVGDLTLSYQVLGNDADGVVVVWDARDAGSQLALARLTELVSGAAES